MLPEHVSNAHHIWNYALFVTQMSSLNGLEAGGMSGVHKKKSGQKCLATGSSSDSTADSLHLLEALMNDLYVNELKQNYAKLNSSEPILSILKIKKRNKASMFNLILPPAAAANVQSLTGADSVFASTTPWLAKLDSNDTAESELGKQDTESSSSSSSSSVEDKAEGKDLDDAESDYYEGCKR